jgi:Phytanoyl-CoA dioxygenase (PhyH)
MVSRGVDSGPRHLSLGYAGLKLIINTREIASSVLGRDYCLLVSRFLIKDTSFSDRIMAHQDWPYFPGDTNKLNIVPLTAAYPANGMLIFLKGSHLYGPLERGAIAIDRYPEFERLPITADVGDVLVADILTWHYSEPATEVSDRILAQIVYQPSSDPSSKYLVSGRILNPVFCAQRATPLEVQTTVISYCEAKAKFDVQDYDNAERISLGVLAADPQIGDPGR